MSHTETTDREVARNFSIVVGSILGFMTILAIVLNLVF